MTRYLLKPGDHVCPRDAVRTDDHWDVGEVLMVTDDGNVIVRWEIAEETLTEQRRNLDLLPAEVTA